MKKLLSCVLLLSCLAAPLAFADAAAKKVAIIVPQDIPALAEITQAFETTLKAQYAGLIDFKVARTQGDTNLLHATIGALRDQNYDVIAPIGSDATAMTVSLVKQTPIVSLASDMSETERQQLKPCHVAVVHDEVASADQLAFIHQAFPTIHHIALIHSAADKIFPEVKETQQAGQRLGITITPMLANSLMDLQTVASNLPKDTQAIFILKDMPIVSGVSQLAKIAKQHHIPLISSDDGSVQNGAAFALGVHESEIGVQGAQLAAAILQGQDACRLPITEMRHLTVFINPKAMAAMGVNREALDSAAQSLHYSIETL